MVQGHWSNMITFRHILPKIFLSHRWSWLLLVAFGGMPAPAAPTVILSPANASYMERLAAREVRRYVYLRTSVLLPITSNPGAAAKADMILVARKDRPLVQQALGANNISTESLASLSAQDYWLKTFPSAPAPVPNRPAPRIRRGLLLLAGGDDVGTLYAAYRFAELLGVRFYLHGDVIPDDQVSWTLPVLDEHAAPLFALRGIQPFHDFPEGPDWWNRDEYLAVIGQLPRLRMNFIGLHTYPENAPNAEPTVWIGLTKDTAPDGRVRSSYPASYMNTMRGNWGYASERTSDYIFGSAQLFDREDFGPQVMFGAMPSPATPDLCNQVFDRTANMLRDAFAFAHQLGVKTCVGTETPLVLPRPVQARLQELNKNPGDPAVLQELYEGIFRRAAQAYPLDYYWFWTPEGWTWSGVKAEQIRATTNDLAMAIAAHRKLRPGFGLATCGWVLGPPQEPALFDQALPKDVAVSCINRQVGYTPVEPGFAQVQGRSKWAIPWMEDDPALSAPQLWVGRMRRDAFDALRYGCDGLMGIHWRTRVLGPNVSALAQAAWKQAPWADSYRTVAPAGGPATPRVPGPAGGQCAAFPNDVITGTTDAPLYQTVRYNLAGYHLPATNGPATVTLKFCEPHYDAPGMRVFDVKLQGRTVLTNLDILGRVGKNRALDYSFTNILVTDGWLDIEFVPRIEFPSIAAILVEGPGFITRINCGGPAYAGYAADSPPAPPPKEVFPLTQDFYQDWALHQFGPEAGLAAAKIFQQVDCAMPKPATWVKGPGGIQPDKRPWDQVKDYGFVDGFAALGPLVKGAGNRERFDYWLSTFLYLRAMGELNCAWGDYNSVIEKVKQEKTPATQAALARQLALPARQKQVRLLAKVFEHLLATVSTTGELGTVANWNQHNLPDLLTAPGAELARLLGEPLPPDAQPDQLYRGPTRIIVPNLRSTLAAGESQQLRVLILSQPPPRHAVLRWRKLGERRFTTVPLTHVVRGVYTVNLPSPGKDDFEYYLQVDSDQGAPAYFPATAPKLNQTVVVTSEG
jgi:hypothetical protein